MSRPGGDVPFRILLAGVGGQGVLTGARILGEAARRAGVPVRLSQVHGLSQRGGSVEAGVALGPGLDARIGRSEADLLLGFEPLEALRALPKLRASARALVEREAVPLNPAVSGAAPSVERALAALAEAVAELRAVELAARVRAAGAPKALNVCLFGFAAGLAWLPVETGALRAVLAEAGPPAYRTVNLEVFELGRRAAAPGREAVG